MSDVVIKESLIVPEEYGVFAKKNFKEGNYIGHMSGNRVSEVIDPTHILWIGEDDDDVPLLIDNKFRYMNHDPKPNCLLHGLVIYALKDISEGEELTWDYGEEFEDSCHSAD